MTTLLLSPDGMLGTAWQQLLQARSIDHRCVSYPQLDLTDPRSVDRAVGNDIRRVINCAAWTDVDGAETREQDALAVNGAGVEHLAGRCAEVGAVLVHYSTDYIFDGQARAPYKVDHPKAPVNAYGRTKAAGELALEASGAEHLILRTSWLYAPWGKNFVLTMARLMGERQSVRVVNDQRGRPSSSVQLARTSLGLLEAGALGTFHTTDGGECSWYELACHIAETLKTDCAVEACGSDEFKTAAKRPTYSVLDVSATEALLGPLPHWHQGVTEALRQAAAQAKG